ncbi:hypothetical protein F52700_13438 [Fusarium sp. NRRL 52700]|nr:hypothetical protein F52700_13438 [Fusarium sp. NRRL 52700]
MAIHSHDIDEKSLAPYSLTADDAAWIYTPLNDNETITEIWWRSIEGNGNAIAVIISYRFMLRSDRQTIASDQQRPRGLPGFRIIDEHLRLVELSFSRIAPIIRDGTDPTIVGINRLKVLFTDELH